MSALLCLTVDPSTLTHLARGCYQRDLLTGRARWSGADLKGKARRFAGRYAASRRGLLNRMTDAGYSVRTVYLGSHGLRTVEVTRTVTPVAVAYVPECVAGMVA